MTVPTNGKSTIMMVAQIALVAIAIMGSFVTVATPIVLMYARIVAIEERMNEIETQFSELDKIGNVHLATQMRTNSMLWRKAYGEDWPNQVYYPEVSRHK